VSKNNYLGRERGKTENPSTINSFDKERNTYFTARRQKCVCSCETSYRALIVCLALSNEIFINHTTMRDLAASDLTQGLPTSPFVSMTFPEGGITE
jgi:hypothetical protein